MARLFLMFFCCANAYKNPGFQPVFWLFLIICVSTTKFLWVDHWELSGAMSGEGEKRNHADVHDYFAGSWSRSRQLPLQKKKSARFGIKASFAVGGLLQKILPSCWFLRKHLGRCRLWQISRFFCQERKINQRTTICSELFPCPADAHESATQTNSHFRENRKWLLKFP